ncbi:MAG: LysR family transcriptional regulator [Rhizobiaceae bacterium]
MDWSAINFDWNRARAFLVTAEEGSLSAAARSLGMAQPTLGRQVRALEEELDVVLFERHGHGLVLTPSGLELVEHVRGMGDAAGRVALAATGQSQSVEGPVTITTTEVMAAFVMPPIIGRLRLAYPGIQVDVVASNELRDLRRREADIALRSVRPTDPDLVAMKLAQESARLYATPDYLVRLGNPQDSAAMSEAQFIGFEDNQPFLQGLNALGLQLTERNFPIRCGDHLVQWEMVKQGLGIGVMVSHVGEAEPSVKCAAPWLPAFEFDVWLAAHREVNTSRRVRLVFDFLADEFKARPAISR